MKKRLISLLLIFCLVLSFVPVMAGAEEVPLTREKLCEYLAIKLNLTEQPEANPFTDTDNYYVLACVQAGIMGGYPDGTFKPAEVVTRAQVAKVLCYAMGLDAEANGTTMPIADVSQSHWAYLYVVAALGAGAMKVDADGKFNPNANVKLSDITYWDLVLTRADLCQLIVNNLFRDYLGDYEDLSIPFTDVPASHPNYRAIAYLYKKGIIGGQTATTFNPAGAVTHGGMLKLLVISITGTDPGNASGTHWASNYYNYAVSNGWFKGTMAQLDAPATMEYYSINWSHKQTATIAFCTQGGTKIPPVTARCGTAIVAPENPTREGYIFDGWFLDSACTVRFTFDTMPTGGATVFARWRSATPPEVELPDANAPLAREKLCEYLALKLNLTEQPKTNPFKDTDNYYVLACFQAGIMNGMSADTFGPKSIVTRAQLSKILCAALKIYGASWQPTTVIPPDIKETDWFYSFALEMLGAGAMKVDADGKFNPNANVKLSDITYWDEWPEYMPGDISGDGGVTTKDVTTLRRYIAGGYSIEYVETALDVNGDGVVTTKDVTTLRRYIAGGYGVVLR